MKHSIDKIVKDKLRSFEKEPPGYVWSGINEQMLENRRRKRVLVFWQSVAAVALLVLSLGIIYTISDKNVKQQQFAETEKVSSEPQTPVENVSPKDISTNAVSVSHTSIKEDNSIKVSEKIKQGRSTHKIPVITHERTVIKSGAKEKRVFIAQTDAEIEVASGNKIIPANISLQEGSPEINKTLSFKTFSDHPELNSKTLITTLQAKRSTPQTFYAMNAPATTYKPIVRKHKFVITGSASPTYNYRNLESSQSALASNSDLSSLNESGIVSFGGGLNIRMESKSRWSFETGVLYSQVGQEVTQSNAYLSIAGMSSLAETYSTYSNGLKDATVNISRSGMSSLGDIDFNNSTTLAVEKGLQRSGVSLAAPMETLDQQPTSLKQLLDYIEVPLTVRYALFNKKPIITLAGGVSTNFLINNSAYLIENGKRIDAGTTEGINNITYSSTLGIGIEYPVGKAFRLSLEPKFKYFLSPVNSKGFNNYHPYSFGVFGGISFILNNH